VIDFHVHLPLDAAGKAASPADVAREVLSYADREGLEAVVVVPVAPYHSNDFAARVAEEGSGRIVAFASVVPNPLDAALGELRRAVEDLGLRGLSLHPPLQGFCLRNPQVWHLLRFAGEELGVPVLVHGPPSTVYVRGAAVQAPWLNSPEDYALLPHVAPRTVIVLSDPGSAAALELFLGIASSSRNIHLDTSHGFLRLARASQAPLESLAGKVLLGTGYPLSGEKAGELATAVRELFGAGAEKVLRGNARDLLGLK
jgi:predicted TIM-barrel fold metal-dependent hydrolase